MTRPLVTAAALALFTMMSAGCLAPPPRPTDIATWTRTELFFGLSRPDGSPITDAEWDRFVQSAITPRFPAGFTVVPAQGHFGSPDQSPHQEPARILILLHPAMADRPNHQDTTPKIDAIAREFASRFNQESVLRIDFPVRARFATTRATSFP
jgi:hypothetical protein